MVNLTKEERVERINLRKDEVKSVSAIYDIKGLVARVALVLDYSGSMSGLYANGTVQEVVEKILPLALNFDDNGELESWFFEDKFKRLPVLTMDNFNGFIDEETKKYKYGGTMYSPVIKDIFKKYVKENPSETPTYVIFITDGDNYDHEETEKVLRDISKYNIFFQFVGIGDATFRFLDKIDNLNGRAVDNAGFFKVEDPENITYKELLKEFPEWLKAFKTYKENEKPTIFSKLFGKR